MRLFLTFSITLIICCRVMIKRTSMIWETFRIGRISLLYDANKVEINLSSEFSDFIPATNQHDKANKRLILIIFEQNRAISNNFLLLYISKMKILSIFVLNPCFKMQILQKLRSKEPIYVNKSILLTPNSLLIGILSLTTKIDGSKLTLSGFSPAFTPFFRTYQMERISILLIKTEKNE